MLQILAPPSVDPRLSSLDRTNLKSAPYNAPLDGTSRPMTQAAALATYPNCGATGTIEQDTAAWMQAEYDLRTGPGGIIGLPDGSQMMLSAQLWLQNAAKVWFHGSRNCVLITAGCGTTPAIRISHADQSRYAVPLRDLYLQAKPARVSVSTNTAGVAHTGYQAGAVALAIDNSQGATFERLAWNGYDAPISWGDNTFGIVFREWTGDGCNYGLNWSQTAGLNSMERMTFEDGAAANCNYGVHWDATYSGNSQGGSVFLKGNSFDYNIIRGIYYRGSADGNSSCGNSFHITGNHIETTGACSGTTLARHFVQGAAFVSHNELYEGDGSHGPGYFEVGDSTSASAVANRMNSNNVPLCYSSTGNNKRVAGDSNVCQDSTVRPVLLQDGRGTRLQSMIDDGDIIEVYNDIDPGAWATYYGKRLALYYYGGAGNLTIPSDATFNFPINYCMQVILRGAGPVIRSTKPSEATSNSVTIVGASGVSVTDYPSTVLSTAGQIAEVQKVSSNTWRVTTRT